MEKGPPKFKPVQEKVMRSYFAVRGERHHLVLKLLLVNNTRFTVPNTFFNA